MEQQRSQTAQPAPTARIPYLPGLDGLRAVAVTGVLLYHAGLGALGGFLGVETFFVLSGFLITALLLAEWRADGRVDLRAFWWRRARRLLPALFALLALTLLAASVLLPEEVADLGAQTLAALAYLMNWHLIATQQSYFDPTMRPPLLQHLWSLAVEEQFYLLWPLLFAFGIARLGRRGMLLATLTGAAASTAAMALLAEPGADPSRVYYGTDTRAAGLLLGAALALVWTPGVAPRLEHPVAGRLLDGAGLIALAGLGVAYALVNEQDPLLYRGGFTLVALATAVVVAACTHSRATLLPRLLGLAPLRWIGQRSYGIYLWHWPIFMLTRPMIDVPFDGPVFTALRFAAVLLLAELSFRFVETPVRQGALAAVWQHLRTPPQPAHLFVPLAQRAADARRRYGTSLWPAKPNRRALTAFVMGALLLANTTCAAPVVLPAEPAATSVPATATEALPAPTSAMIAVADATSTTAPTSPPVLATATPAPVVATATVEAEVAPAEPQPLSPELAAALQNVLDQLVADGTIPGAVLSVQIPGYEPWTGAAGIADRRAATMMAPETRVRTASISKIFTAVVVLQLVEEGVLALDAPVSTWLPGMLPRDDITVAQLLQHTSGLYDYLEDRNFVNRAYRSARPFAPREMVEYAVQFPLSAKPGAAGSWDYSSTNYVLLGMIVEQATGNTLAEELRSRIITPLALSGTFVTPDEAVEGPASRGYSKTTDQTNAPMSIVFGTAGIVSTADDMRRFANALFGGELLEAQTMVQMQTFVSGKGQYNMPELEYGLGLMRSRLPVGKGLDGVAHPQEASRVLGHIGGFGGFRAALWYGEDNGIIVALGMNQAATDPNILATRVWDTILDYREHP
jgi:peptidoglycan/LPS O-acetylase OafA/YrhL/CubicO group peptidase (beta-lactamase class C family)